MAEPTLAALAARLERLELIEEARAVTYAYAKAVDAHDEAGLRAILADDVVLSRGRKQDHGPDGFLKMYQDFWASDVERSKHYLANAIVEEVAPPRVSLHSSFVTSYLAGPDVRVGWGEYWDVVERRDGRAVLVAKRIEVHGFMGFPGAWAAAGGNAGWARKDKA